MRRRIIGEYAIVLALLAVCGVPQRVAALSTAFTYQGQLQLSGSPTTGPCDLQFMLFDAAGSGSAPTGGNQIGNTAAENDVQISNGLFTVPLDFGAAAFSTGSDRWLQIAVRCPAGSGSFQTLAPRQALTPAPFALFASNVADGSVSSAKLAPGAVTTATLATNAVTSAQIADGTITMDDLANGAVSTTKIGDGQVSAAKLVAPLSLTSTVAHSFVGAFDGTSTGLDSVGVSGTANNGTNASGVYGLATAGAGVAGDSTSGTGVVGTSNSGTGVVGRNLGNPARGVGSIGAGVVGESATAEGVRGMSSNGTGVLGRGADGVVGETTGSGGAGVRGEADQGQFAIGVVGESTDGSGVVGHSATGVGVAGLSDGGDGVKGETTLSNGYGVHGVANSGDMARGQAGVSGESTNGFGIAGLGRIGVFANTNARDGIAVFGFTKLGGDDDADANGVKGGATNGIGVYGDSEKSTGVYGRSNALSTFTIAGVVGEAAGNNGIGVRGVADVGTNAWGVFGESASGIGVRASSTNGIGVRASSTNGAGISGTSAAAAATGVMSDGVRGEGTGNNGNGVHGIANSGSGAFAVYGESTSGYAGYFSGKVSVTGALTAGVKPFKIDHPLDPANKYLMHAAVESPDMKNIYDGIAVLDDAGEAVVELPVWFEALNRDFRYQLTCIGGVAPVYVAEEVSDHHFRIAGGTSGLKVSWQVTGIRKDAFANAHPLVVELDKSTEERGRYLYPVELGMPASLSVDHAKEVVAQ